MIYPGDFEQKLGFDQVRQHIKTYCLSPAGAGEADKITFSSDLEWIRTSLKQNLEFRQILERGEEFPGRYFLDPAEWLKKISLEGNYLDGEELIDLANAMQTILACQAFLEKNKEPYPELFRLTEDVTVTDSISRLIFSKIDENATVKDTASPELSRIRRMLREEQGKLRRLTDQIFRKASEEKWVPEGALPTIREGRLVIPVLAEHKRRLRGFVLDESATGQTVFIEPAEMLDANNAIRELEHAEFREVIAILKEITSVLHQNISLISIAFDFLARIDMVRAKARFSVETGADMPQLKEGPALVWYQARHPLLYLTLKKSKRAIVPLDIELSREEHMLLISGPNAGGKSVTLKTVGLIQYMLQCGLLVPLSDRSQVGIFRDIFLDIGDQQSIENDLSTYSSHLRNMAEFLRSTSGNSLVLMDELGSGTDPNFGGAIAQAVLHGLLSRKTWCISTTHYYNLKLFAGQHGGIRNAAMRFDDKNLIPLFVLDIGKPGSSFALEIARKTGLPQQILHEAEQIAGKELAGFETLVRNLEREREELRRRIRRLEEQEKDLKQNMARYETLASELESRKKEIIDSAKSEAQHLLKETNREIEKTIRHIRENKAERKETQKVRKGLQELSRKVKHESSTATVPPTTQVLQAGDRVRLSGQHGTGEILSLKGKMATVRFGELKSVVDISRLEKVGGPGKEAASYSPSRNLINLQEKRVSFSHTLDLRGKRVEEVAPLLENFMDTAVLLGQAELKILHGKGEGVLRKVVRDHLKRYKEVASFGDEHVERGGDGITVVVLK